MSTTLYSQLMGAVKDARAICQRDADSQRRDFRFQHWRETELTGADEHGSRHGSGDPIFFGPRCPLTKKNLVDALRQLREGGAVSANLAGGIDGSDDFGFSDYQPYIAEWDVNIDTPTMDRLLTFTVWRKVP